MFVWAAGVKAPDVLKDIAGLETNRINQLVVRTTLQTTRDDHVFALGDCAACPWVGNGGNVPPRAQSAHQQASHLYGQIRRRLAGKAWQGDPRFAALAHGYLAQAQMLEQALLASPMDERTRAQWRFLLRQVIDAASPANCLATNPEVMQQAFESGGMSLAAG